MSDKLKTLSAAQKKVVVGIACYIEAQGKGGRFRSDDPEMDIIVKECFDDSWVGNWDSDYRHQYLGQAAIYAANNEKECLRIAAELDAEAKFAFKNMMIDIIGDNAMMMLHAAYIYGEIGMPVFKQPEKKEPVREDRNTQEDDGTYVIEDCYRRLADIGAVRGENDKVFTMVDQNEDTRDSVGANYDYWLNHGICPVSGLVGYVNPRQSVDTPEGKLYYLVCTGNLVIPVLEWGLEKIDEWEYRDKVQNDRMLSWDRSGELCRELRAKKKPSEPQGTRVRVTAPQDDRKVVRWTATVQQRIEGGRVFPSNYIERFIKLTYSKRGSMLELEVVGAMKPRTAKIKSDDGRVLTYVDTMRPFAYYEVETEPEHNSIVRVSIFQKNENFEDLEYRYTVDRHND